MLPSLRRVREVREKAEKKRNERIMLMTTIAGVAISIAAAGAALWTGYEAHETRMNDERPFVAVDASTEIPQAMQFASNQQFSPGELLPLQTVVTAFGKSPSERIHITCAIVADNPGVEWKQTKTFAKWDFAFLLPSRSGEIGCPYVGPPSTQPKNADITYIQFGVADYQDGSGTNFRTPFCQWIIPGTPTFHVRPCSESYGLPKLQ